MGPNENGGDFIREAQTILAEFKLFDKNIYRCSLIKSLATYCSKFYQKHKSWLSVDLSVLGLWKKFCVLVLKRIILAFRAKCVTCIRKIATGRLILLSQYQHERPRPDHSVLSLCTCLLSCDKIFHLN
jgi:hypothetical protein